MARITINSNDMDKIDIALADSSGNAVLWAVPVETNGKNVLGLVAVLQPGTYYFAVVPVEDVNSDIIYNFIIHTESKN